MKPSKTEVKEFHLKHLVETPFDELVANEIGKQHPTPKEVEAFTNEWMGKPFPKTLSGHRFSNKEEFNAFLLHRAEHATTEAFTERVNELTEQSEDNYTSPYWTHRGLRI